jgi:predicted transcriptional regulator
LVARTVLALGDIMGIDQNPQRPPKMSEWTQFDYIMNTLEEMKADVKEIRQDQKDHNKKHTDLATEVAVMKSETKSTARNRALLFGLLSSVIVACLDRLVKKF